MCRWAIAVPLTGLLDRQNMKKRTAASTLLLSLVAVAGCNSGDGEYVNYEKTAVSEFEENQKHQAALKHDATQVLDSTSSAPKDAESLESNGVATKSSDVSNVKSASHSTNTDVGDSKDLTDNGADNGAKSSTPALDSTTVNSIVSAQSGLTGRADTPEIDNSTTQVANKIELLIPDKSFRRERGTDAVRISYDDIDLLKVLNMEPVPPNAVEYFPEWLASLNGKQIRIRGWMYPTFVSEGLTSFTLARDNGICCFQRMPKIYDVIFVKLEEGQATDYIAARPFDVEGTFRIDNEGDGSDLPRLYKIENARVLD